MIKLNEVRLAGGVDKKYKFEDADIGRVASHNTGFTHIGVVQGHDVYHRPCASKTHDFVMTKENDRKIHTHLNTYQTKGGAHNVNFLQSKTGHGPGVHHLYHHLITKHNIMLTSNNQSEGGAGVWRKMSKMRGVHVHAVDAKGVGHHVDLDDLRDTHVNPTDIHNAKTSAKIKQLKSIMARRLVAHKS